MDIIITLTLDIFLISKIFLLDFCVIFRVFHHEVNHETFLCNFAVSFRVVVLVCTFNGKHGCSPINEISHSKAFL